MCRKSRFRLCSQQNCSQLSQKGPFGRCRAIGNVDPQPTGQKRALSSPPLTLNPVPRLLHTQDSAGGLHRAESGLWLLCVASPKAAWRKEFRVSSAGTIPAGTGLSPRKGSVCRGFAAAKETSWLRVTFAVQPEPRVPQQQQRMAAVPRDTTTIA